MKLRKDMSNRKRVVLQRAQRQDQAALVRLWVDFLAEQEAADGRLRAADDARERWNNDYPFWLEDASRWLTVARVRDDLVGFIRARRWQPPPIYAGDPEVYIDEVYVAPPYRRRGIGRRLVDAARAWASSVSAKRLRLTLLASNRAAEAFWTREGAEPFTLTATLPLSGAPSTSDAEPRGANLGFRQNRSAPGT